MKIFRFDDRSINSDWKLEFAMTDFLLERFPDCKIIHAFSPAVHDLSKENSPITRQRIFPKIFNAMSDVRIFYKIDKVGMPPLHPKAICAGHGLIHADHRLLSRDVQELSILSSCSLTNAKIFIPPFNKYNNHTEEICAEHGIELVKFEDGWLCMEYNNFNPSHDLWYLHAREFTLKEFKDWFE